MGTSVVKFHTFRFSSQLIMMAVRAGVVCLAVLVICGLSSAKSARLARATDGEDRASYNPQNPTDGSPYCNIEWSFVADCADVAEAIGQSASNYFQNNGYEDCENPQTPESSLCVSQAVSVDREYFRGTFLYMPDGNSNTYGFELMQRGYEPNLCNVVGHGYASYLLAPSMYCAMESIMLDTGLYSTYPFQQVVDDSMCPGSFGFFNVNCEHAHKK